MKWQASAPANIALIKYMGKADEKNNIPGNASLSYTLNNLLSFVELEITDADTDCWESFPRSDAHFSHQQNQAVPQPIQKLHLSEAGKTRFLTHLQNIKKTFNSKQHFIVRSTNNFPSDCGLASSASSFAALTKVACSALAEITGQSPSPTNLELAQLSRTASGSSCRSFFEPWALWRGENVEPIVLPFKNLKHKVIIIERGKKEISSSEAHRLVTSSLLFKGRKERAERRLNHLIAAFRETNWRKAYEIVWQEFWDMHALFETASSPFGYMTPATMQALEKLRKQWQVDQDGPLITMDAGPNIHLLYRDDQLESQSI